jgi:hypothetical protein
MSELPGADAARLSRRWLVLVLVAVLAVAALAGARHFAARSAATGSAPAAEAPPAGAADAPAPADTPAPADCEEEPPPESFTLAECDADGNPVEAAEPAAGTPGGP